MTPVSPPKSISPANSAFAGGGCSGGAGWDDALAAPVVCSCATAPWLCARAVQARTPRPAAAVVSPVLGAVETKLPPHSLKHLRRT